LEVDVDAMAANVGPTAGSERVLAALTARLGKHEAQARMHQALRPGATRPGALDQTGLLDAGELAGVLGAPAIEGAQAMVDEVVARSRAARLVETDQWG
jgi:adenylosuccinate lyase